MNHLKIKNLFMLPFLVAFLFSCQSKKKVDGLYFNAHIIGLEHLKDSAQAFVIKDGKFLDIGSDDEIKDKYQALGSNDMKGSFIYPGFYDAHAHFYGYALGLLNCDLVGSKSVFDVKNRLLKDFKEKNRVEGDGWILGRGWDQNLFFGKRYPNRKSLDSIFPNVPVLLKRIDGHAAWCNSKALEIAKINKTTKIKGGEIVLENGEVSGILIDNAVDLVSKFVPPFTEKQILSSLKIAEKNCFEVGITSLVDAGLEPDSIFKLMKFQESGELKIQIYAMASPSKNSFEKIISKGFIQTKGLDCRAVKVYADGAMGSRGACLLADYSDRKGHKGFLLQKPSYYDSIFQEIKRYKFQVATHAIGDSANRFIINEYVKNAPESQKKDFRWRLEHAQNVTLQDIDRSKLADMIFSVQPTHATSDMYWVEERLGKERMENAYPYAAFILAKPEKVCIGSDFPVENINPLYGFFAAITRQDKKGFPEEGFLMQNAITREEAFLGMTKWAAYSCFQENRKGIIKKGFQADFVVMKENLFTAKALDIYKAKIKEVYISGEKVW